MPWNCYNCNRELRDRAIKHIVVTEHGQEVPVGSDCVKKIREAGEDGHFSEVAGVELFTRTNWLASHDADESEISKYE